MALPVAQAVPQQMPPQIPAPSSYPRIATSTLLSDSLPVTVHMQPTPTPELRRRQVSDSLGWNDPSTCNVGVCTRSIDRCIVFKSDGLRADTATGVCCVFILSLIVAAAIVLLYIHACRTVVTHFLLEQILTEQYTVWTPDFPYCVSRYIKYGWGLGTFLRIGCHRSNPLVTTYVNPSWELYITETNPAKGPIPTTTTNIETTASSDVSTSLMRASTSSSVFSTSLTLASTSSSVISTTLTLALTSSSVISTSPTLAPVTVVRINTGLATGAIAGIVIGAIIAVAVGVVLVMVAWFKLRRATGVAETAVYDRRELDASELRDGGYVIPQVGEMEAPQRERELAGVAPRDGVERPVEIGS
ncbi:hypothetical protein K440DRAFT_665294 [Wilcoxina mikolae CBS 423.85]|nr:hypothetical protein K440DRAFT_665294 [Wilcoxina mikolae CBS 423.85]